MVKERTPKKPKKSVKRLNPKSLAIWGLLVLILFGLNSLAFTPEGRLHLTVNQVFELARSRLIQSAEIQAVESGGPQWYRIRGTLRRDGATFLPTLQKEAPALFGRKGKGLKTAVVIPNKFEAEGRLTDARFNELTADNFDFRLKEKPANTLLSSLLNSTLPFLVVLLVLYFLFMRQIRSASKGAMGFGRSRMRPLQEDKKKVTFNDVAGCDEAKEEVREIVEFLKNPQKFQDIGGRIPKGCLMVGSPGTGKTLLAKAVAGEADVPFFSISGSDFVEMFVGVGASRVRDMFEQAKQNSPCLVFIDEIDAVGRKRGAGLGGGNDEREQTLNALLVEMDGFESRDGIIIVAATNRPDVLDNALLRPGRFDRQVMLDLPDLHGREEILRVHAKKIKLSKDVDLAVVARNTSGYSGADLENLLNESALLAARYSKERVEPCDLDEARDKISFGRERKKLMDEKDKRITAYHEAGHAIIQATLDDGLLPVHKVTIIPRGQSLGSTMMLPSKDILNYSKTHLLNQICTSLGGRVAEEMIFNEQSSGASSDIRSATKLARRMVCDWGMSSLGPVAFGDNREHIFLGEEIAREQNYSERTAQRIDEAISALVGEQYQRACELLKEKKNCLEVLAQALLKYETLEGTHVKEILATGTLNTETLDKQTTKVKKTTETSKGNASTTDSAAEAEKTEKPTEKV